MKTKILLVLAFCIACINISNAQNPRTILDNAYNEYSKLKGVVVKFQLDAKDIKANQTFSQIGTAYVKGDKFKIELTEAISWFDGKTQWIYIKDNEEVNITNPEKEDLETINPTLLFSIYKQGFDLKYSGEKTTGGKTVQVVEMNAQKKNAGLKKILVEINKSDKTFSRIVIYDKNGMENTLIIKNYSPNNSLDEKIFIFDKNEFPNAEIVDLR